MILVNDSKSFTKCVSSIRTSGKVLRDNVQSGAMWALDQFAVHSGNTDPIDRLALALIDNGDGNADKPVGDAARFIGYIESLANVKWKRDTAKDKMRFVRNAGETAEVQTPTINWFEWRKTKNKAKAKVDPDKVMQGALKRIATAIDEGTLGCSKARARKVMKAVAFALEHMDDKAELEVVASEKQAA